ncbi:hypothetical protein [Aureimonas sp. AU22]|uniref:hypothetical protein n=1 Tax=Aureimonas sp. AU22 TaxID=1638162 RepID=UPI00078116DB|nr:hypothetical protein [Aureimonas sp. AU22]
MNRAPFPPFVDAKGAFSNLEPTISRIHRLAKLQRFLAETYLEGGTSEFKEEVADGMTTLAADIFEAAHMLDDLWLQFWNSGICDRSSGEIAQ